MWCKVEGGGCGMAGIDITAAAFCAYRVDAVVNGRNSRADELDDDKLSAWAGTLWREKDVLVRN